MSDVDLFSAATLQDPYPRYRDLRELGPAVYLQRHGAWFLGRHAEVKAAQADWQTFSSAHGIGLNAIINEVWAQGRFDRVTTN
jgi:cytochrome P450